MALKATIDGSEQAQQYIELVALSGTMSGLQYCKYSVTHHGNVLILLIHARGEPCSAWHEYHRSVMCIW